MDGKLLFNGVLGIAGVVSLFTGGGIAFNSQDYEQEKAARQQRHNRQDALIQSEKDRKKYQAIANDRHKDGCDLIAGTMRKTGNKIFFTMPAITPGVPVKDVHTGRPIAFKTICDVYGVTAITDKNGHPQSLASTGDRNVIQATIKRFRGGVYSQPGLDIKPNTEIQIGYAQPKHGK